MTNERQTSYQALSEELDMLLAELESGALDIEEAMTAFEKGEKLIKQLENYLQKAEVKINKLKLKKQ